MKLINNSKLKQAEYNPRKNDEFRLNLLELSLKKLGFILPLFILEDGTIISGHQRNLCAKRLGIKKVPVEYVNVNDKYQEQKVNFMFNVGTNEKSSQEHFNKSRFTPELINKFQDMDDCVDLYPCMKPTLIDKEKLLKENCLIKNKIGNTNKELKRVTSLSPIIINSDYIIINGKSRLANMTSDKIPCIIIPKEKEEFVNLAVNHLTMDFDISPFKDMLRYNSFKRKSVKFRGIGDGFVCRFLSSRKNIIHFPDSLKQKWIKYYGDCIVDFGAGKLNNTTILNNNGIKCVPFEPFIVGKNDFEHDKELSLRVCKNFIKEIKKGTIFSSIFLHAVFNSVPFEEDRKRILNILCPLMTEQTKLIIYTRNVKSFTAGSKLRTISRPSGTVFLDYEKNVYIGDIKNNPKVQKFYGEYELYQLLKGYFEVVKMKEESSYIYAECSKPYPVDDGVLRDSILFEYDLPFRDGSSMDLHRDAIDAYNWRLGINLKY